MSSNNSANTNSSSNTNNNSNSEETVPEVLPEVEWTIDHEDILIEWADKAMCFRWLHSRAHAMYSRLNYIYTIPVIIIFLYIH
jgi:hypothetical protein